VIQIYVQEKLFKINSVIPDIANTGENINQSENAKVVEIAEPEFKIILDSASVVSLVLLVAKEVILNRAHVC